MDDLGLTLVLGAEHVCVHMHMGESPKPAIPLLSKVRDGHARTMAMDLKPRPPRKGGRKGVHCHHSDSHILSDLRTNNLKTPTARQVP